MQTIAQIVADPTRVLAIGENRDPGVDGNRAPLRIPSLRAVQVIRSNGRGTALYTLPAEDLQARIDRCPACKGIGYFRRDVAYPWEPGFGTLVECETCAPFQRELSRRERLLRLGPLIARYSTLKGHLLEKTFSGYDTGEDGVRAGYNAVSRWTRHAAGEGEGPLWLYLWGPVGTGKTHLAAAAANYLRERHVPVVMATMPQLLGMVRAADWGAKEALVTHLGEVPILILDDAGAENKTGWTEENLFRIVDSRYNLRLPLFVVSNLPPDEVGHERVGSRVQDTEIAEVAFVKAGDYRRHRGGSEATG
jgi:DNA replication protein DnaC